MDGDDERTIWCGNLSEKVSEDVLYELFLQAGPVQKVRIPKGNKDGRPLTYGFVTFKQTVSVEYAVNLLDGTLLHDKRINLKPRVNPQEQNVQRREVTDVQNVQAYYDKNVLMQAGANMLRYQNTNNPHNNRNSYRGKTGHNFRNNQRGDKKPYNRSPNAGKNNNYGNYNRPHNSNDRNKSYRRL